MSTRQRNYTIAEMLCVYFWFLLDGLWLFEWRTATMVVSAMALLVCFAMPVWWPGSRVVIAVSLADACWLIGNITWAYGDLYHEKEWLTTAKACFVLAHIWILVALSMSEPGKKLSQMVLSRLRVGQTVDPEQEKSK